MEKKCISVLASFIAEDDQRVASICNYLNQDTKKGHGDYFWNNITQQLIKKMETHTQTETDSCI